jgi:hypothetical protein
VGEFVRDDVFQPFEPAAVTESFVRDSLLIAPTTEELKKLGVMETGSSVLVTVVEAGKTLRIRSTAAEGDVARTKAVHQFIADGILNRLKGRAMYAKARLERRLLEAQERLGFASKNLAIFSEILSDAKTSEATIRELARQLANEISENSRSQQGSSPPIAATDATDGLTRRGQLTVYQRLGFAEIPSLQANSATTVVDLEQSAAQSQQVITDLNAQLAVFREPVVTQFMVRSISPAGSSSRLLTLLVGLVAGFTTYFAARLIQKGQLSGQPLLVSVFRTFTGGEL